MQLPPDIKPLRSMPKKIEAACYNQVRLALIRRHKPLKLELPRHACLEIILDQEDWLCVDTVQAGMPILRWHSFEVHDRHDLHQPINCQLDLYHFCAGLVMGSVLDDVELVIKQHLAQTDAE